MKPSPALGKCDQCMIIKESIGLNKKMTKSGKSKCPAAARVGINPTPSMLQTKQLTFIYFSLTLIISILAFVVLSHRDTKP